MGFGDVIGRYVGGQAKRALRKVKGKIRRKVRDVRRGVRKARKAIRKFEKTPLGQGIGAVAGIAEGFLPPAVANMAKTAYSVGMTGKLPSADDLMSKAAQMASPYASKAMSAASPYANQAMSMAQPYMDTADQFMGAADQMRRMRPRPPLTGRKPSTAGIRGKLNARKSVGDALKGYSWF